MNINIYQLFIMCPFMQPMVLYSQLEKQEKVELTIRRVAELPPTDPHHLQIISIIMRRISECDDLGLQLLGRDVVDFKQAIEIKDHHLTIIPGMKTSMRNHENNILFGIDINHRVLRTETCLKAIRDLQKKFAPLVSGSCLSPCSVSVCKVNI